MPGSNTPRVSWSRAVFRWRHLSIVVGMLVVVGAGLRLWLHSERQAKELSEQMECGVVPQPAFILVEDINRYHQHIDFTYFARIDPRNVPDDDALAARGFHWFAPGDLHFEGVPQNVRVAAQRAVDWEVTAVQ